MKKNSVLPDVPLTGPVTALRGLDDNASDERANFVFLATTEDGEQIALWLNLD